MKHKADLILRLEGKSSAMADSLKKLDIKYVLLRYSNYLFLLFHLLNKKIFELLMFLLLFSPKYTAYTSAVASEDLSANYYYTNHLPISYHSYLRTICDSICT